MILFPSLRKWMAVACLLGSLFLFSNVWIDRLVSESKTTLVHPTANATRASASGVPQLPLEPNLENDGAQDSTKDDLSVIGASTRSSAPGDNILSPLGRNVPTPNLDSSKDYAFPDGQVASLPSVHNAIDDLPLHVELEEEPPGLKPHPNLYSETYLPRGLPISDSVRQRLAEEWGSWTFVDPSPHAQRPQGDFYAKYPSRDVPSSQFPEGAWQIDSAYVKEFLEQGRSLVQRAMEAILTEYGHGRHQQPDQSFDDRSAMFRVEFSSDPFAGGTLTRGNDAGGTMNSRSFQGLVRRLLHALITQDTFRLVTAGHSVAAGHLNMFPQGYTVQVQRILEPVFARLGVTMSAHSIAVGGMGTLMNALAARDVYGNDVDVLLYDAGYTEPEIQSSDLFLRQGMLSGKKVPFLWIRENFKRVFQSGIYAYLDNECQVDIGVFGTGMVGIPRMATFQDVHDAPTTLPWATQYVNCDPEIIEECRRFEFDTVCWVERDDYKPLVEQKTNTFRMGGGHHPGNRFHQLQGRVLAFVILTALDQALEAWSHAAAEGQGDDVLPLPADSVWHVHDHYRSLRDGLMALNRTTPCHTDAKFPVRACDIPMRGRSEFTPRVRPYASSLRSIAVGAPYLEDWVEPNEYDPPDVIVKPIDATGDVDVMNIVENGGPFVPLLGRLRRRQERRHDQLLKKERRQRQPPTNATSSTSSWSVNPDIKPGRGWGLVTTSGPDLCDGSYDSFCDRSLHTDCLLLGFNDKRGGLLFDGLSGWLILKLEDLHHGLIAIKIEDYHPGENDRTKGWECENNENCGGGGGGDGDSSGLRALRPATASEEGATTTSQAPPPNRRQLRRPDPSYCDDFRFDYALDGNVTTWDLVEWKARMHNAANFVQLWTLLDDPSYHNVGGPVELALRMRGCGRRTAFYLTHVYWS